MSCSFDFHIVFEDNAVLGSIVVSIPACHAGDPGSIPGQEDFRAFLTCIFDDWRRSKVGKVERH
jgi:hypothetical protein